MLQQDSKCGGQHRSGKDYYQDWDEFADQAVKQTDQADAISDQESAKHPGIHEVDVAGPARTQRLIELNKDLPLADRRAMAETAKARGNDFYRWVYMLGVACMQQSS